MVKALPVSLGVSQGGGTYLSIKGGSQVPPFAGPFPASQASLPEYMAGTRGRNPHGNLTGEGILGRRVHHGSGAETGTF